MPPELRLHDHDRDSYFANLDNRRKSNLQNLHASIDLWRDWNDRACQHQYKRSICQSLTKRKEHTVQARMYRAKARIEWGSITGYGVMLMQDGMGFEAGKIIGAARKMGERMGWVFGDEGDGGNGGSAA